MEKIKNILIKNTLFIYGANLVYQETTEFTNKIKNMK